MGALAGAAGTLSPPSHGGSMDSGGAAGAPESPLDLTDYPSLLSSTGLYADIGTGGLAPGVRFFSPQFALWSDGSTKSRWLYLPPGTQIETSDMDNWVFPAGTKFWKEFRSDRLADGTRATQPIRVETRLLWKFGNGRFDWSSVAYVWNEAQTEALATPDGSNNALGTLHDVPSRQACDSCHTNKRERQVGPGAVQLSHAGPGLTLDTLIAEGLLSVPPVAPIVVPGDETDRAALGYLHANCGHCHRAGSVAGERHDVRTWLTVASLTSVEATDTFRYYVNRLTDVPESQLQYRILGGSPDQSELIRRMQLRGDPAQMPPGGTELVDEAGVQLLRTWIARLPSN